MPDINDYRKAVQDAYEDAKKNRTLKLLLNSPSPENIRNACLEILETRFDRNEIEMLFGFFGKAANIQELKKLVKGHEREKFIPVGRFLQHETTRPNITITEFAAWLIDFQLRPFNNFYTSYNVENPEVNAQKNSSQPRDVKINSEKFNENTKENDIINIPSIASQPEDIAKAGTIINPIDGNPSQNEETEPDSQAPAIMVIGKRIMTVAAIFLCLFVMTGLFKTQQERHTKPVALLTQPLVTPITKNESTIEKQEIPYKKKAELKGTNKRCQSMTLKGKQCKWNATKGDYCWQHPLD